MKSIVIIGNGISGVTAARHIRKKTDYNITIISDETDFFYSRTALMYIYMGHMEYHHTKPYEDWFWEKNKINLVRDFVKTIDSDGKKLILEKGEPISYDILIIATGSKSNKFGWPGQDLKGVQGLYGIPDVENMEKFTDGIDRAVVVGGGLIGIEMVEMLQSRQIPVTFLVRENNFWDRVLPVEESKMVNRHLREHHVDLRLSTELDEILGDEDGRVKAVKTKEGEEIPCQFVGLTVGVRPNIDFLQNSKIETGKGVLVNDYFETNIEGIYAIGDCAEYRNPPASRKKIEQVWYTGRIHGEIVANTICGNPTTYKPGVWFNSAKFMDIEYQVYGDVSNIPSEDEHHIYWEHPDGRKSIRIVFDRANAFVKGFNLMGIRYRHEICEKWIKQKKPITEVLKNLRKANFDPEFFDRYEDELISKYNELDPEHALKRKKKVVLGLFSI